jgi:hypothetical protein
VKSMTGGIFLMLNENQKTIKMLKEEREFYLAANRIVERRIRKINKRISDMSKKPCSMR